MRLRLITVSSLILFAFAAWVGCSSGPTGNSVPNSVMEGGAPKKWHHHRRRPGVYGNYISHIFIVIQENRSLNNLFAGFPGTNTTMTGYEVSPSGTPIPVPLKAEPLYTPGDIDHCYVDAVTAINGASEPMDGFNNEYLGGCGTGARAKLQPYAYVQQSDIQPYWDIAENWVLAANFYPTELGPSFTAHQNLIASTTEIKPNKALVNFPSGEPWGCDAPSGTKTQLLTPTKTPSPGDYDGPFPCLSQYHTMADLLDGLYTPSPGSPSPTVIPWRYYAPTFVPSVSNGFIWSAFDAIDRVRNGPDWNKDVISPETKIFNDIQKGNLKNVGVVWVVPNCNHSDHPGCPKDEGPSWVADVVNAIGTSNLWSSSVIVILWDDWGGWYDNASPPLLDFQGYMGYGIRRGYGIRTPMLILSPYAKQGQDNGHVSLRQFEPGSILRFIEQVFNLPPLGSLGCDYGSYPSGCGLQYTDQSAKSIDYTLDFTQSPRPFSTIPATCNAPCIQAESPPSQPPDDE